MKVRLIKIARYGSEIGLSDKYNYYCKSTSGQVDPDVDYPISYRDKYTEGEHSVIASSPLLRAQSSAGYLSKKIIVIDELREVKFELSKLVTKREYMRFGSDIVRERFVQAFIEDKLGEKRKNIMRRIETLKKRLQGNDVVAVSHSFVMKIAQAHHEGCDLVKCPEQLLNYINPDQRTFSYGEGFEMRYNEEAI